MQGGGRLYRWTEMTAYSGNWPLATLLQLRLWEAYVLRDKSGPCNGLSGLSEGRTRVRQGVAR